ncbi:hypothetical protein GCM10025868_01490 [Angustibacter aerolatus]|uniref:Uncharacterized protein n=1 Tax=Angustibacter aerolatus TaxID=1162965 RepID=A0ABQ6JAT2_9ACTN|nr:hypothetical protein GCM10025868_01490 [Angustibacter aerolatus]
MTDTSDPHDLQRFVDAQDDDGTYARALAEPARRPQAVALDVVRAAAGWRGSDAARRPGATPCTTSTRRRPTWRTRCSARGCARPARRCWRSTTPTPTPCWARSTPPARSSMTLFEVAAPTEGVFADVLLRLFDGRRDDATLHLLRGPS